MSVNSINSINTTNATTSAEDYKKDYGALSKTWTEKYSTNTYLSSDFKKEINDKLNKLNGLINSNEEQKNNEEIANLITELTNIINGNDSMMSLDQRINCLTALNNFENSTKGKDIDTDQYNTIKDTLNDTELLYKNEAAFYHVLYSSILDNYSSKIDQNTKNAIQKLIDEQVDKNANNIDGFYSQFMSTTLESKKENLHSKDYTDINGKTYDTIADFFNDLNPALMTYTVYKTKQDNISSASRASLNNKTLSMKVMQESNAYKLLEIDNLMSEELNKRAEMDPAMKRLRDGIYWADNKEIKPQDNVNVEDELWTKKQE